jgi:hypothetical protein
VRAPARARGWALLAERVELAERPRAGGGVVSGGVIHYAGAVTYSTTRGGGVHLHAGWAACCTGDRAREIRRRGAHTYDRAAVTCGSCKRVLVLADAWAAKGATRT